MFKSIDNSSRARSFRNTLLRWFARSRRQDPWRNNPTPYSVWIAEVMLQQTVVKAVIPYYEAWMSRWPSVDKLAAASEQAVLRQWEGLGYYTRARNLHRAAQVMVEKFDGRVPNDYDQLISLPGVGDYTASAIMSIAFKKPFAVVDANVRRVTARFLALSAEAATSEIAIREFVEEAISRREPGQFNEAVMELGQKICRSRSPLCPTCPVRDLCSYWTNVDQRLPRPTSSNPKIILNSLVLVITFGDRVLLEKRSAGRFSMMWSLPTQSLTGGVTSRKLSTFLRKLGIDNHMQYNRLHPRQHNYTKYSDTLSPVVVTIDPTTTIPSACHSWVSLVNLETHPMPTVHREILREYLDS